jgi:nucleoside-diphosphate-sugar epimerase
MRELGRCLVIGGAGMLGYEIVRQLAAAGSAVRVLDLQPLPARDLAGVIDARIGDIRRRDDVLDACGGVDVVFQTAAAVWDVRTPRETYDEVNVEGNANVLDACRRRGVRRLVYTSSMDVVVDGRKPIVDGDESLPYPARMPRDDYSRTKIVAEKMILGSSGRELATCALRPVGMYGPRDKYHLGTIIGMARRGVSLRLGNGTARFSHAYSENVAHAHLLAARHLWPGSIAAGQAYFICDHFPADNLFDFMERFLRALDLPVPRRSIPYRLAYPLAAAAELFAPRSDFNRFAVIQTCVDHTFVHHKAMRDLGYHPIVSREEAFRRSLEWLKGPAS